VSNETWFADSNSRGGTRFGTVASLAGIQNIAAISIRKVAANSHHRVPTSGIEMNSRHRALSPTTIVHRRSSRSATTPAIGPKSTAGISRRTNTPATA
jgi:hypothetical protein